jgi:undecaprenyl-diphosphatase
MTDFDVVRATVLALVQGFTEFLPVSSSAHLILPAALLGWEDQGLAFDVAVHLGTLLAVVLYFRRELYAIARGMLVQLGGKGSSDESRLGWMLVVATLPVVLAGLLLKDMVDQHLREVWVLAATTLLFGALLWVADRRYSRAGIGLRNLPWRSVLLIGLAQMLALIPGTSRSGVTMTAALLCGMDRESASRFSFLLSIPVILGAALLLLADLLQAAAVNWVELGYGMLLSMLTALLCIHWFLGLIARTGFLPFVLYRMLLGCVLLFWVLL